MQTYSFIGADKNAGKTTMLNFVYDRLYKDHKRICLTSIGINGEEKDNYEGHPKPRIKIKKNSFFITQKDHLTDLPGFYQTEKIFTQPTYKDTFILGKALFDLSLVLEGPNEKREILKIKEELPKNLLLLIDGSIDRQFLGDPTISDAFYFAISIDQSRLSKKN